MAQLDHVGIAVEDVNDVIDCFDRLLNRRPYKAETVSLQEIRTHFLNTKNTTLELLDSLSETSPIHRFLEQRGEGLHHLAFEVKDLVSTMKQLREAGFTLLSDTPQPGADDKKVFFVHPKDTHGVLVEFCATQTPPPWSPDTVSHRDGQLAFYERGTPSNPCLLLLHGAGGTTCLDTAPLMRTLEPHYHVVGVDLTGHGDTSLPPDNTLTLDRFVEDVHRTLDAVNRSSAHLFGFSLGSAVALQYAADHPDAVDHLALFAPHLMWDADDVKALNGHLDLEALQRHIPRQAERLAAQHQRPKTLFQALQDFVETLPSTNEDRADTAADISHHTLVAGLDADPLFSIEDTQAVHDHLPNARLALLPGRSHRIKDSADLLASLFHRHFSKSHMP